MSVAGDPNGGRLYGQGVDFPPRIGADGHLGWSAGELNVRQSICIILRTRPGERILRPEFGCGLDRFLFEPNSVGTLRLIQEEVKRALERWERRIVLEDVRVATNQADPRAVDITVGYRLVATQVRERVGLTLTSRT
jgi:phage baseplate assembly protein W